MTRSDREADSASCALCGLPAPEPAVHDAGRRYCCTGCREVARLLGPEAPGSVRAASPAASASWSAAGAGGPAAAATAAASAADPATGREAFFHVGGMHCASCARLIELLAARIDGVLGVQVGGATGTARIVFDPARIAPAELAARLNATGYRFRARGQPCPEYDERAELLRMLAGACLASAVMMLSFTFVYPLHLGWVEVQDYAAVSWLAFGVVPKMLALLSTVQVFVVGWPILRGAATALRVGGLNMDLLLALSVVSAYAYSLFQLLHDPVDLYFDVATGVVAVVAIGRYLERGAREAALAEIGRFLQAQPQQARVVRRGECFFCGVDEIEPGDRVVVREGETVAADGVVVSGAGALDESLLTGEPFPAERRSGDRVLGGAVLREGHLEIDVGERVRSRIADLAQVLWQAQAHSGAAWGGTERVARAFVPLVIGLALLVAAGFIVSGAGAQRALLAALATLIVSCPCTFGLAIPLTLAGATSQALRRGILVTRPQLFDRDTRVDTVVVDKTGTLSSGEMVVRSVTGPPELAGLAAAVERDSAHPVARAIARLDGRWTARDLRVEPGRGAIGSVGNRRVAVGSRALFESLQWPVPDALQQQLDESTRASGIASYVGWDGKVLGAIVTHDEPRPRWEAVVERLRGRGRSVLLTGAASAEGYGARFDEVFTGAPPEAKAAVVRRLRERGRVAMVGDGSNDAPALAQADLAIAFGSPTTLAAQAADLVVAGDRLERVADALDIVDAARRRVRQNLGWALSYNAIALPLAMMGMINPLWAALAMTASSLLVVWNATRALLPHDDAAGNATQAQAAARPLET